MKSAGSQCPFWKFISFKFKFDFNIYVTKQHLLLPKWNLQGRTALFENGRKYFDETGIKKMMDTYQKNKKEIDIVTVGWVVLGPRSESPKVKIT